MLLVFELVTLITLFFWWSTKTPIKPMDGPSILLSKNQDMVSSDGIDIRAGVD